MVRLGYFTGKIYDGSFDVNDIEECYVTLNYKPPVFDDEELVVRKRIALKKLCQGCNKDCGESRRARDLVAEVK